MASLWDWIKQWSCLGHRHNKGYHLLRRQAIEDQASMMPSPPPPYREYNITNSSELHVSRDGSLRSGWVRFSMLKDTSVGSFSDYPFFHSTIGEEVPWHEFLELSVKDLLALMKRGLQWSEEDIVVEAGYFETQQHRIPPLPTSLGFTYVRHYKLIDRSEERQWEGGMLVYAREIQELANFKPSNLSVDNIRFLIAGDTNNQIVYQFDRIRGERNFNAIYDNMPLEGWWPWPKGKETENDEAIKAGAQRTVS